MITALLGLLSSILIVAISFTIKRFNVIVISGITGFVNIFLYVSLNASIPAWLSVVAVAFSALMIFLLKKSPKTADNINLQLGLLAVYTTVFFALNGFTMSVELLAYIGSILMVIVLFIKNPIHNKWVMLVAGGTWALYQFIAGAYTALIGQGIYAAGVIFALTLLYKAQSKGQDLSTVKEVGPFLKEKLFAN